MISSRRHKDTVQIDVAVSFLGNIGLYQIKVYLLSCLPVFIAGAISTSLFFTTAIPEFRCMVDGCDPGQSLHRNRSLDIYNRPFLSFSTPKLSTSHHNQYDTCHVFERTNSQFPTISSCFEQLFDPNSVRECTEFVYDQKHFDSTIVKDFNLVCSSSWMVQILQSSFFVGILIGSIVNGVIGDRFGRKTIFIVISPTLLVALFLSALSFDVFIYAICLVLKGICVASIYQSAFVIGMEFLGGRWRFWLANFHSIVFALGSIYSCIIANKFRAWRFIEISNTFPVMLMLSFPCIFPESIKWKISNGKIKSAIKQIHKAARTNRIVIDKEIVASNNSRDSHKNKATILDLFTHKTVRVWTISLLYIWFTNSLVYYGLSFLSGSINENIYYSMILLSVAEIPGIFFTTLAVERYSRRFVLMAVLIIGGFSCTISSLLPESWPIVKIFLTIFGKANISGSFSLIYVYTVEIFPTILRISGLGLCSVFSRFGGISAPYLLKLEIFGNYFPFFAIGLSSLIGGLACTILPETKDKELPDTLNEVSQLENPVGLAPISVDHTVDFGDERVNLLENEM